MCIRDRIRSELREYQHAWEEKINELQKKPEDTVKELKEDKQKHKTKVWMHEDADNIVDFTDMSTTRNYQLWGQM